MAFFFTFLYLLAAYVTPPVLFGPVSEYHIEIIVVLLAIVTSIPNLPGSGLGRAPQAVALAGMAFSIVASIAQTGWLGGAVGPIYGFMQPAFAFVLVAVNCKTRRHLQWIIFSFVAGSAFFMFEGLRDLQQDVVPSVFLYGDFGMRRMRGLGFVNDPNDFAQIMVSLVPAVFLWRKKSVFLDLFLVGIPVALLITGTYLTHSRGGILALTVVVLLAARRKIGVIPASIGASALMLALFASGASGGREVSMDAGADRLDLWYDGMETIKAHPLFGIGLNGFADKFGITAHNSVVICASELGVIGLYFWVFLIFSTIRKTIHLGGLAVDATPEDGAGLGRPAFPHRSATQERGGMATKPLPALQRPGLREAIVAVSDPREAAVADLWNTDETDESVRDMARLLLLSLAGLLTAGWFLSRALSMWLFMYCGMIYAVSRMSATARAQEGDKLSALAKWSVLVTVGLLLVLYIILRARNIGH